MVNSGGPPLSCIAHRVSGVDLPHGGRGLYVIEVGGGEAERSSSTYLSRSSHTGSSFSGLAAMMTDSRVGDGRSESAHPDYSVRWWARLVRDSEPAS